MYIVFLGIMETDGGITESRIIGIAVDGVKF